MTEDSEFAIEAHSVSKTYRPRSHAPIHALRALTLRVHTGEALAVLGATGAGKTTIVKLFAELTTPTAGQIRLLGHDPRREPHALAGRVGVVLADRPTVAVSHTVWAALLEAGRRWGLGEQDGAERAADCLHAVNLWEWRDESIGALPDGVRRRAALALALLADPPILLLDEPIGDSVAAEAAALLAAIRAVRSRGKTIVLATSRLALACDLCDRVAILDHGHLVVEQSMAELRGLLRQERYELVVQGHLDHRWADWFEGLALRHTEQGTTVLSGVIADQAALHGLLLKVRNLNLPLLSVNRVEPEMNEVLRYLLGG